MAEQSSTRELERYFPGDSELARRMREHPWSETAVGDPATWPANLRVAVGICVTSRFPTALWWGSDRTLVYNDAFLAFLGRSRHPTALGRAGRDGLPAVWDTIAPLIDEAFESRTGSVTDEMLGQGEEADGDASWTCAFSPILGEDGRVDGVICTAQRVIARSADPRVSLAQDELLATLGHELRNPLSPILTTLQLMQLKGTSPELDLLDRQVRHLTRLVDDVVDVSRIARGKLTIRKQPTELASVVDLALEVAGPLVEQRDQQVVVCVPRRGLRVDVDSHRMVQVIANLITNASKFSETGSKIVIDASPIGAEIRISVKDRGVGIDPAMIEKVFDQGQEQRKIGGGLSLAITRSLVELHGGRVEVTSEGRGKGSEFAVVLPRLEAAEPSVPGKSRGEPNGKRVLIVEDNDDAARSLRTAIEAIGYTVEVAHDGPVALQVAKAFKPDIALLDIGLPVMDGYELARRMRTINEAFPQLHFVAVTGYGQDNYRQRSVDAGFAEHLVKPVDLEELERVVDDLPVKPVDS